MTASRSYRITAADLSKRAALQESTAGLKKLLAKREYTDIPERMTEFELVHEHVVMFGSRITDDWNVTAFELHDVVAGCVQGRKVLAHSCGPDRAKVFAQMDENGLVRPAKGGHYDAMAETLLDESREVRLIIDVLKL